MCQGLPYLQLNSQGNLLAKDAVYSYLDVDKTDISFEQVFCEYVMTVTDENTDPLYTDKRSRAVPAKVNISHIPYTEPLHKVGNCMLYTLTDHNFVEKEEE